MAGTDPARHFFSCRPAVSFAYGGRPAGGHNKKLYFGNGHYFFTVEYPYRHPARHLLRVPGEAAA